MDDLELAYAAWRDQDFPPGSAVDALDELHADLVLADVWVANAVVPFVEQGLYQPAQVDVVGELLKLDARAGELASASVGEEAQLACDYRSYVSRLLGVYQAFLAQPRRDS